MAVRFVEQHRHASFVGPDLREQQGSEENPGYTLLDPLES
jgi:hypothetical protein